MKISDYDVRSLELFVSVVEHGNIARAAKSNNIAASAVSKRMSDLEVRARVELLLRQRDGVAPTAAGETFYRHAKTTLDMLGRLDAEISEFADGAQGVIRIFANSSAITQFLPEDISSFSKDYPDVRFDLREGTSVQGIEALRQGAADLAIFSEHVPHEDIQSRLYRRDTLMLVTPRNHELDGRARAKLADALPFDHIGLQDDSTLQAKVVAEAERMGSTIRTRVVVLSFDGVRKMVEAGLGVAILPRGAVVPYIDTLEIAAVELDESWAVRTLFIGYRDIDTLPVVCRRFIDHLAPQKT